MIGISEKCAEIMMSSVRPKAEPIIRASRTNTDGTETVIEWKAKNIKNFTYKRGIDPIGRTLPYMELIWTEVYSEKSEFEDWQKYLSASQYMLVKFSIIQNLNFYNDWSLLYKNNITWKELYQEKKTWKNLKNNILTETITFPALFLEGKPTIQNLTVTWVARDFLYFLNKPFTKTFEHTEGRPFFEPIVVALKENRIEFSDYAEILNCIDKSISYLENLHLSFNPNLYLNKTISVSSDTKNFVKNYSSIECIYWFFGEDGNLQDGYYEWWFVGAQKTRFFKKTMFNKPKKTKITPVSNFLFKYYSLTDNGDWISVDDSFTINTIGENFVEDNPTNPYNSNTYDVMKKRKDVLQEYFNPDSVIIEFESLPNFELEPDDVCEIQSNDFYVSGTPIMHKAILLEIELSYNGAFKQKTIAHEINHPVG